MEHNRNVIDKGNTIIYLREINKIWVQLCKSFILVVF